MYYSILVGQDASDGSRKALEMAIWFAQTTRAHLRLIHLHPRGRLSGSGPPSEEVQAALDERIEMCGAANLSCDGRFVEGGSIRGLILESRWHDLVVVGKRGEGASKSPKRLGRHPIALLASSPVPVLVVDDEPELPSSVLVAFDETPDACTALRIAASLALERGLRLHVVEVVGPRHRRDQLGRAKEYLDDCPGLQVELERLEGKPLDAISSYIEANQIHLTFLPALDRTLLGHKLTAGVASRTSSSMVVPAGRTPSVY